MNIDAVDFDRAYVKGKCKGFLNAMQIFGNDYAQGFRKGKAKGRASGLAKGAWKERLVGQLTGWGTRTVRRNGRAG